MKVWILSKGVGGVKPQIQTLILVVLKTHWGQSQSIDPYFLIQKKKKIAKTVPRMFFNTTKIEVWIWGLTPPTPLDKFHTFVF